ncbi:phosphopantothenoylcysteine decarboxylase [Vagococcus luciliae]|uniref:Coenzyme A biosynthesis bifunctional protein CoaBC n=1 Tax=Vagococcus luciliae TaxID=2920380 RepID=A0ABY5NYH2_9ENTE|nr:phosphopantothenoylcysteine decarboxylase [Vagococcus luciliae]UUV98699.1 Coenzyme A biosynthesis bifunctional protein CoaBC [Vagococcus luciliae]
MNILITAGGTSEAIDSVRNLTNHATGSLGKVIAETLSPHVHTIFYVHGPRAVLPDKDNIHNYPISSVRDLEKTMHDLLTTHTIHTVIHSMAVSDYELDYTTSEVNLAKQLADVITTKQPATKENLETLIKETLISNQFVTNKEKKIRSTSEQLIIALKKAPKVIHSIKKWQPTTQLIGFKLLVGVPEIDLVTAAKESIEKNKADYIVANDLEHISTTQHQALIINQIGIKERCETKQDIANSLLNIIKQEE